MKNYVEYDFIAKWYIDNAINIAQNSKLPYQSEQQLYYRITSFSYHKDYRIIAIDVKVYGYNTDMIYYTFGMIFLPWSDIPTCCIYYDDPTTGEKVRKVQSILSAKMIINYYRHPFSKDNELFNYLSIKYNKPKILDRISNYLLLRGN